MRDDVCEIWNKLPVYSRELVGDCLLYAAFIWTEENTKIIRIRRRTDQLNERDETVAQDHTW